MREPSRTLPLRVPPQPGEALDSWLEATAHRHSAPLGDVLAQLGFPRGRPQRDDPADSSRWTVVLRDHEAETIAAATGVPAQQVADLTLARYQDRALRIDITARTVNRQVLWGRSSGSRFCPHCLDETEGRWQLSWRLGCRRSLNLDPFGVDES